MKKLLTLTAMITLIFALTGCGGEKNKSSESADPYLWLEEVEGEGALDWAREQNKISDEAFVSQPLFAELRDRFLEIFNDKERVIYPDMVGNFIYNLWQDETNERGLWRRMSKEDYLSGKNNWEVVLDLDKLSAEENRKWVFHGASWLGPENKYCLVYLSDGGKDESVIREFDASKATFVTDGFNVKESDKLWTRYYDYFRVSHYCKIMEERSRSLRCRSPSCNRYRKDGGLRQWNERQRETVCFRRFKKRIL
jgi:prolyl oligopeptidase